MFTPRGPILSPSYRHNFLSHNTFSYEGRRLHPIENTLIVAVAGRMSKKIADDELPIGRQGFLGVSFLSAV